MATVLNKARPAEGVDPPYEQPNRVNAGTPVASLTPLYAGEIVKDTGSSNLYIAVPRPGVALANTDWAIYQTVSAG